MPNVDGIAATRLLAGPDVRDPSAVVVIASFDTDEYVRRALLDTGVTARPLAGFSDRSAGAAPIQPSIP